VADVRRAINVRDSSRDVEFFLWLFH